MDGPRLEAAEDSRGSSLRDERGFTDAEAEARRNHKSNTPDGRQYTQLPCCISKFSFEDEYSESISFSSLRGIGLPR